MQRIHIYSCFYRHFYPPPAGVWGYDQQTVQVLKKMQQETLPPDDITVDQNEVCVCVCVCVCLPACVYMCVWQCEVYIAGPLWVTTNKPINPSLILWSCVVECMYIHKIAT